MRPAWNALGLAALLAWAAGCATAPPGGPRPASPLPDARPTAAAPGPSPSPAPAPASPMPGTPVGTTASGGEIVTHAAAPAVLDTLPSADARAVLATIPEPLPAGERVPPPKLPAAAASPPPSAPAQAGAPAAARADSGQATRPDSSAAPRDTAAADSTAAPDADIPVPEPTRPLGDRPRPAAPDTASSAAPSPPPAPAPTAPPHPSPAKPDTCWRVQVAAVPESKRAEALRAAAESQLLVAWVIEKDGKLFKVRTKDCYGSAGADGLRKRAVAAGFGGAFRFRDPAR